MAPTLREAQRILAVYPENLSEADSLRRAVALSVQLATPSWMSNLTALTVADDLLRFFEMRHR